MSKQVVVYPSGYVGYDVGWPIIRNEPNFDAQVAVARFASASVKEKLVIANSSVETLFAEWRYKTRRTTQADFVGDICGAVANAFGTESFYEWCLMQLQNPYFTANHRQYLNETLAYIVRGEARGISYPTWATLLTPIRANATDRQEPYMFQDVLLPLGVEQLGVQSIIRRWVGREKGLDDMLVTAHLLFGEVL